MMVQPRRENDSAPTHAHSILNQSKLCYHGYMTNLTIPRQLTKGEELVVIPRREYEEFSEWREAVKRFKEFTPTVAQRRDLLRARTEYSRGKLLTHDEFKRRMAALGKRKRS